jgi:Fic family protein
MTDAASHYVPFAGSDRWVGARVGNAWAEFENALEQAKATAEPADYERALDVALRSAALETGAIEGLYATDRGVTRSVAIQGALWEAQLERIGPDVRGHFDAQLAAFELVLDVAAKSSEISEAWIRSLHATTCANQATYKVLTPFGWQDKDLVHGSYKTEPNHVTLPNGEQHWYAPVDDTRPEMHRLVTELASDAFTKAHPAVQAAFAHYALVAVHPFSDGNGRVARALASVFLYRGCGVPLVVFSDQQTRYFDALAEADTGSNGSFVTLIEERAIDAMALVTDRLRETRQPLDDKVAGLRRLLVSHGGLPHAEVQGAGLRLVDQIASALNETIEGLGLGVDIQPSVGVNNLRINCTYWDLPYQPLQSGGQITVNLACAAPTQASAGGTPTVGIARDVTESFAFIVVDASRSGVLPLRLRLGDIYPAVSTVAESRIDSWARAMINTLIDEVSTTLAANIRNVGL